MQDKNLAAITMSSSADKKANIEKAFALVRQAAVAGAEWVQLPEVFPYIGDYEMNFEMGEEEGGQLHQNLSSLAKELGICLFAGTVGERAKSLAPKSRHSYERVYNTMYVFNRDGSQVAKYRKTHLFNLHNEQGDPLYCEGDGFIPGDELCSFDLEGVRVGLAICYDLRFPAMFEKLAAENPLDLLVVPAAFTQKTGAAHWEVLLRARAIEQQSYVWAANQTGTHGVGKVSYGHSMLVDPWGGTVAQTTGEEGIAQGNIATKFLTDVRGRLPALSNRRFELYR